MRRLTSILGEHPRCHYCKNTVKRVTHENGVALPPYTATRDHYIAQSHGGSGGDNIILACLFCNNLRGDMEAYAFTIKLRRLFIRNPGLRQRWHQLATDEQKWIRLQILDTHERMLHGLGIVSLESAFRHMQLLRQHGYHLSGQT